MTKAYLIYSYYAPISNDYCDIAYSSHDCANGNDIRTENNIMRYCVQKSRRRQMKRTITTILRTTVAMVPMVTISALKTIYMRGGCFVLFDLILYAPSTIFQLNRDGSSWVEPALSQDKCVLLKDHSAVTPVRLEPAALRSRVKHSTTEPLRSRGAGALQALLLVGNMYS